MNLLRTAIGFLVFFGLIACQVVLDIKGRRNAGKNFEPGGGFGSPEDYES